MKRNQIIHCILLLVIAFAAVKVNASEEMVTSLRSAVVANPDSVLRVLDKLEASRSKELPDYQISLLRGMAYNEKHMYSLVEKYAELTLASDSIKNNPQTKLSALNMLSLARSYFGNYQGSIECMTEAMKIAIDLGNDAMRCGILSNMASTSFTMGNRKGGYEYLERVIEPNKGSDDVRVLANVSSAYGIKIIELYTDGKYAEGLEAGHRRLQLIDKIEQMGGSPEGYVDQQRAYAYARIASCAEKLDKKSEAANAYGQFMATTYAQNPVGRAYIMDYLLESHQWRKVLEFTAPLYQIFQAQDTINDDYRSLLASDAMAQAGLGNYREGYDLTRRASAIQDSLYFREKSTRAQELATIFELNEKNLELSTAHADAQRRYTIMIAAIGFVVLILVVLLQLFCAYRKSLKRQQIAARQIDELIAVNHTPTELGEDSEDYRIFSDMQQKIMKEGLFRSPGFNRDGIAEATGIPRSKVSKLIECFAGMSVSDYINKLRVDYSVQVINEHPNWTIDAIAEMCGYVRRATYYSHFNRRFGITPAQYRNELSKKS